jgi:hypothetical protein
MATTKSGWAEQPVVQMRHQSCPQTLVNTNTNININTWIERQVEAHGHPARRLRMADASDQVHAVGPIVQAQATCESEM